MSKKTVLLVTLVPDGGMVHYAAQLANSLATKTSVQQLLPTGAETDLFDDRVDIQTVDVPVSLSEFGSGMLSSWQQLREELRNSSADIVHATQVQPFLLTVLPTLCQKRFALTLHDVVQHKGEYKFRKEVATRGILKAADQVFVHSQHSKQQSKEKFGQNKDVRAVPHGDYSFFTEYCDQGITYENELLFFGRIKPYKGVDWLLKACEQLDRTATISDDYRIRIAGSGSLPEGVSKYENVVVENEFLSNERVCRLFSQCRAVVLPYREATQSGVIPISYSFRKPVIATRCGGIPEVVEDGETGKLVTFGDTETLVNSCQHFLSNEHEARRMGAAAYNFKEQNMDWDSIAKRMLDAY